MLEWFETIVPIVCGAYSKTPAEVADLTPAEISWMIDGVDWVNDRAWERAIFLKTGSERFARDLLELSYPHFRAGGDRIVAIEHPPDEEEPRPPEQVFGRKVRRG